MENITSRTSIILANEIRTERKDNSAYDVTPIRGGKHCAICDVMEKNGARHNEQWNMVEREQKKVNNRVTISGYARGVFLCDRHKNALRYALAGYCTENRIRNGKPTKDGLTVSFEVETSDLTDKGATTIICNFDAIPTSDSTVFVEIKTPIFNSLQGATKLLGTLEALMNSGDLQINNTCGTHLHVGTYAGNVDFMRLLSPARNYTAFFAPVALYISRNLTAEKRIEYFGRDYGTWARRVWFDENYCRCDGTYNNMSQCHVAMFNVQHTYSVEWRLPKFTSAEQYRRCIMGLQNIVKPLTDAFATCGGYDISAENLRKAGNKAKERFEVIFPA